MLKVFLCQVWWSTPINPSTLEAKTGALEVQGWLGLHSE
jgi:hypothetical protein